MVKGTEQQKVHSNKAGTPAKASTKPAAATAGTKTGSPAAAGPGRSQPAKNGQAFSGNKGHAGKAEAQPLTPARRAMDGPELDVPTEAEIESQIKQLLSNGDDSASSQELTLDFIIRSHISDDPELSVARRAASEVIVRQLTHIRLDRQRLGALNPDVMRQMSSVTHLFLQHNRLSSTGALAALPGLKFLSLGHNQIEKVDGLTKLTQLMFLDLSYNRITSLDERSLPPSLHFLKLEGNPCAVGHANRYCLRRALRARCPQLRHMDRDLDEDGEEISDDEDDDDDGEVEAEAEARVVGGALEGDEASGDGGMLEDMLDMLDDLERRAYQGAAARSGALLRSSLTRSSDLRTSMQRRASAGDVAGSRPGTSSGMGSRPGTGSGAGAGAGAGAVSRPSTGTTGTPPRPRSSGTGGTFPGAAAASTAASSALSAPRGGNAGDGPLAAATSSARSPSPGPAGAGSKRTGSGSLSLCGSGGSRPNSAGSATAAVGRLGPVAPLLPQPRVQPGSGGTPQQRAAALEQQVEDDLGMLQARLHALLEPTSTSTLTQDAAIFDARQLIHSQLDRMRGQASERMSAQREADAAVSEAIRRLRTSSTLTTLRDQINLGPSKAAAARTAAAVAAARRAGPVEPATVMGAAAARPGPGPGPEDIGAAGEGGGAEQPPRPWSSGSGMGGGVPLQLPLGPGPVQTLPHNVLRESLSRLESMLGGSGRPGSSSGRPTSASVPAAAAAVAGAAAPRNKTATSGAAASGTSKPTTVANTGGKATGRGSSSGSAAEGGGGGAALSGKSILSTEPVGTGDSGRVSGGASSSNVAVGAAPRSRPVSASRPGSASGRPAGAVIAAAKAATGATDKGPVAAADLEAERLTGDDAGTEGLYEDEEDPEAAIVADAPDFGFMFKSSLPTNPFGPGGGSAGARR